MRQMSTVYHDKRPHFGFFFTQVDSNRTWPQDFTPVAELATDDLDEIFRLTNSIGQPWTQNTGVRCLLPNARSTSVGDMVVDSKGKVWLCCLIGWKELGPANKPILIQPKDFQEEE